MQLINILYFITAVTAVAIPATTESEVPTTSVDYDPNNVLVKRDWCLDVDCDFSQNDPTGEEINSDCLSVGCGECNRDNKCDSGSDSISSLSDFRC